MTNAILNPDRTRKNIVSVDEVTARSTECPIDILDTDIFIENVPDIPEEFIVPRLLPDNSTWEEAATADQLAARDVMVQNIVEKEAVRKAKAIGFAYKGMMVPVTNDDAIGAMQLAIGFEQMGMQSTSFHLSNGEKLILTLNEWAEFKVLFFTERAKFFSSVI